VLEFSVLLVASSRLARITARFTAFLLSAHGGAAVRVGDRDP
jgi:hypothetical protein